MGPVKYGRLIKGKAISIFNPAEMEVIIEMVDINLCKQSIGI